MIRNLLLRQEYEERTAFLEKERSVTYKALAEMAGNFRRRIEAEGFERTALLLPDTEIFAAAFFGTMMANSIVFPMNALLTGREIKDFLLQGEAQALITSEKFRKLLEQSGVCRAWNGIIIYAEEMEKDQKTTGNVSGEAEQNSVTERTTEREPAIFLGTSGTTGRAKIVCLSEENFEHSVCSYIAKMDYEKYEEGMIRYTLGVPFSSIYGLLVLTVCFKKGFTVVSLGEPFTLDALYRAVERDKITHYEGGVMAALWMERMLGRPIPYDIRSLRYLGLAGSKISAGVLMRLKDAFPEKEFWTGYGMTEASPLIAKPYKTMKPEKFASVGTAVEGETLLIEKDGTRTGAPYVKGEVIVKGPNVMLGYYRNVDETNRVIRDGFLYTGDIGYLDEDGYLYLCGRKKNVMIVRGFNVYAEEVESCILDSGLAADCRVYGKTDSGDSDIVCADVVFTQSDAQAQKEKLRGYLRNRLAVYKQPAEIHIVKYIEKTATGKSKKAAGERADGTD